MDEFGLMYAIERLIDAKINARAVESGSDTFYKEQKVQQARNDVILELDRIKHLINEKQ